MIRCLVEIIHEICSLARTDGGTTSRALSLVSKTIRDISELVGVQSLTLRSANQTISFSSFLKSKPTPPPRIRLILIRGTMVLKMPRFPSDTPSLQQLSFYILLSQPPLAVFSLLRSLGAATTRWMRCMPPTPPFLPVDQPEVFHP